jgi:hypothetical protein
VTERTLPDRGDGDSDEAWGDEPRADEDRLETERPPHYDR